MNSNRVFLEPAYVLHRRAYRESSFLIELFSYAYGRLTLVAKGVRKAKSQSSGLLQPFVPLLVSWSGKSDLMTMTQVEAKAEVMSMPKEILVNGFYINELLMALLQKWDAHPKLFQNYEKILIHFKAGHFSESLLRSFEKQLLEELGYGFLPKLGQQQTNFLPDRHYHFVEEQGFVLIETENNLDGYKVFLGKNLTAIAREDFAEDQILNDAKRLIRLILKPLLGTKQIHSRKLFIKSEEPQALACERSGHEKHN